MFGYVLLAALVIGAIAWLASRDDMHKRATLAVGLALVFCLPYLGYTSALTGQPFCWATSGGIQLYWMSSPHEGEKGDWINYVLAARHDATDANPIVRNHGAVFAAALRFEGVYED
jgi:hypothetical protein